MKKFKGITALALSALMLMISVPAYADEIASEEVTETVIMDEIGENSELEQVEETELIFETETPEDVAVIPETESIGETEAEVPVIDATDLDAVQLQEVMTNGWTTGTHLVYIDIPEGKTTTLYSNVYNPGNVALTYKWSTGYEYLGNYEFLGSDDYLITKPIMNNCYYTCEVSDDNGNRSVINYYIYAEPSWTIEGQTAKYDHNENIVEASYGEKVKLSVKVVNPNNAKLTYQWENVYPVSSEPIEGKTSTTYTTDPVEKDVMYGCTVTDENGCSQMIIYRIKVLNTAVKWSIEDYQTNIYVKKGDVTTLKVNINNPNNETLHYSWSWHDILTYEQRTSTGKTLTTDPVNGTQYYSVEVTDDAGNEKWASFRVHVDNGWRLNESGNTDFIHMSAKKGEKFEFEAPVINPNNVNLKYSWNIDYRCGTDMSDHIVKYSDMNDSTLTIDPLLANVRVMLTVSDEYSRFESLNYIVEVDCAHTYEATETKKATLSANGKITKKCTKCGDVTTSTVYYPKTFTLSKTSYVYDGTVKSPAINIKDTKGKVIDPKYYTVTKDAGRKLVGKYNYKITFKSKYSGTKTVSFVINPKPTTLSSVTAGTGKMTVKWAKMTAQTTGYQIQYSTSSTFASGNKTVTVSSNTTTGKSITNLTKGKKYYVRIRTYKTVGSTKYYSAWSAKKYATIK